MNNEFSILAQFLENLGPEVSGRAAESIGLSEDQIDQIKKFAAGELPAEQRDALLPDILANETALHQLVQALQAK